MVFLNFIPSILRSKDLIVLLSYLYFVILMPRVSEKGQVTIPKEVRDILGIHPGDEVEFEKENGDIKIVKKVEDTVFDKYIGYLGKGKTDKVIRELRGEID